MNLDKENPPREIPTKKIPDETTPLRDNENVNPGKNNPINPKSDEPNKKI